MIESILVLNWTGKVRKEVRNGRTFYVASATMIVPGVLNGSQGALFYPPEEIARDPATWNAMPIVLYHPEGQDEYGNVYHMSARDPDIAEKYQIGNVYRATINEENGALDAEAWFDVHLLKQVRGGEVVLSMLEKGKPIGLSTGLFTTNYPADEGAIFNSPVKGEVPYTHIARHYRPDHLAILPDVPGACGLDEGCGVNVTNNDDYLLKSKLRQALVSFGSDAWILDARDGVVIFKQNGKTLKQTYTIESAGTTMEKIVLGSNEPSQVKQIGTYYRRASFNPATNALDLDTNNTEVYMFDRKRAIAYLTANCKCWQGKDEKAFLEKATDDLIKEQVAITHNGKAIVVNADTVDWGKLAKMIGVDIDPKSDPVGFVTAMQSALDGIQSKLSGETATEVETPQEDMNEPGAEVPVAAEAMNPDDMTEEEKAKMAQNILAGKPLPKLKKKATPVNNNAANTPKKPATAKEWLASAPPEVQAMVTNAIANDRKRKTDLINRLTANIADQAAKSIVQAAYNKMQTQELEALVAVLPATRNQNVGSIFDDPSYVATNCQVVNTPAPAPLFNYEGQGPVNNGGYEEEEGLALPELYPAGYKK